MKQLKFMLAAATAIGLATAAQAADTATPTAEENFDSYAAGTAATNLTGFVYSGADPADDESAVVAGGYNNSANALQVNTGTDPLLRALKQMGTAQQLNLADYKSVYIDTMVQFTVTPHGDTVTPGVDDKLMIYLKEDLSDAEAPVTNLIVRAAAYSEGFVDGGREYVVIPPDPVEPNTWYRLVVKAKVIQLGESGYWPVFEVYLGGDTEEFQLIAENESGIADINEDYDFMANFVSLQIQSEDGEAADAETLSLQYVGFAGEGLVDDLSIGTVTEVTAVDFSFTWTDAKISAVTYTIGGVTDQTVTKGEAISGYEPGTLVTLTVTPATWYKLASATPITYTVPAEVSEAQSLDDYVTAAASADQSGNVTVTEGTTATDLGIAAGSAFADANTTVLGNLMTWATADTKGGATVAEAAALVNSMTFDTNDNPTSDAAKAYLLDCAPTEEAIEDAREDFKLTISFDENGAPVVEGPDGAETYKNGKIVLKGRASLSEGNWDAKAAGHKFFKAFLTK